MDELECDILQELGNIGANNAATAISRLFGNRIDVSITKAKVIEIKEIAERIGAPETVVGAVFVRMLSNVPGGLLLVMPRDATLASVDMLTGKPPGETQQLQQMDASAFREFGNMTTGAYISAISNFLEMRLNQSVPYMAFDMVGAIVDYIAIEISKFSEHATLVRTEFSAGKIRGGIFLILDSHAAKELLKHGKTKMGQE